jgi:hypothetical protein
VAASLKFGMKLWGFSTQSSILVKTDICLYGIVVRQFESTPDMGPFELTTRTMPDIFHSDVDPSLDLYS